ncbi:hypothetical protein [Demequina sp.]|uniref:hypothetical protein n=1 Tax=Demequina sp. TaxID=2050685 RepID=UPI0025B8D109|nr:hypothetical protein [Demequina sp.]
MDPGDPRTLDAYRYAENNPVTYTDASGLRITATDRTRGSAVNNEDKFWNTHKDLNPGTGRQKPAVPKRPTRVLPGASESRDSDDGAQQIIESAPTADDLGLKPPSVHKVATDPDRPWLQVWNSYVDRYLYHRELLLADLLGEPAVASDGSVRYPSTQIRSNVQTVPELAEVDFILRVYDAGFGAYAGSDDFLELNGSLDMLMEPEISTQWELWVHESYRLDALTSEGLLVFGSSKLFDLAMDKATKVRGKGSLT